MKSPIRIAITGAAGNIGYALVFRVAAGDVFGKDQPIILHLLEIPGAEDKLKALKMEIEDCALPLVSRRHITAAHAVSQRTNPIFFRDAECVQLGFHCRRQGKHFAVIGGM